MMQDPGCMTLVTPAAVLHADHSPHCDVRVVVFPSILPWRQSPLDPQSPSLRRPLVLCRSVVVLSFCLFPPVCFFFCVCLRWCVLQKLRPRPVSLPQRNGGCCCERGRQAAGANPSPCGTLDFPPPLPLLPLLIFWRCLWLVKNKAFEPLHRTEEVMLRIAMNASLRHAAVPDLAPEHEGFVCLGLLASHR